MKHFEHLYNFNCLTYPVPLSDIDKFCKRNNCSMNIYGIKDSKDLNEDEDVERIESGVVSGIKIY